MRKKLRIMSFKNRTPKQIEKAKTGLWAIQQHKELKEMHNLEYGSCRTCKHDELLNNPRCSDCINGGGPLKLFEVKENKRSIHQVYTGR